MNEQENDQGWAYQLELEQRRFLEETDYLIKDEHYLFNLGEINV